MVGVHLKGPSPHPPPSPPSLPHPPRRLRPTRPLPPLLPPRLRRRRRPPLPLALRHHPLLRPRPPTRRPLLPPLALRPLPLPPLPLPFPPFPRRLRGHPPRRLFLRGQAPQRQGPSRLRRHPLRAARGHVAVKSTKRACIVGGAFECYYKMIAQMPDWSKLDLCEFAVAWAGQACPCRNEFDPVPGNDVIDNVENGIRDLAIGGCKEMEQGEGAVDVATKDNKEEEPSGSGRGSRIPLPWELLQPLLRILGHCLLAPTVGQDVKDAAVQSLYARAMHDLVPQSILATRSLIHLDKSTRAAAREASAAGVQAASNPGTPSKPKKHEIPLVSK